MATHLITGANRGIGYEYCRQLQARGDREFEVNALGALRVTSTLLLLLKAGSKIILMTSRMGSIGDNTSGSSYG